MTFTHNYVIAMMVAIVMVNGVIPPENNSRRNCVPFRNLLTETLVEYSATYFSDNPRSTNEILNPNLITDLTPSSLFREFYGPHASARDFELAILRIYYSDPGQEGPNQEDSDRIFLRENIYTYARASSYVLAREKFGLLLYLDVEEYASGSPFWNSYRCVADEFVDDINQVIITELERVRNEIGEFRFGRFLGLGSGTTLAFAIDDTGSMSGEIAAAKQRAKQIIDERRGSLDQPQDFVLVPFNDPTVGPVTSTNNPVVFEQAIDRLFAHGGGDAPELALRGILQAIENSKVGSTIFVITDIDAKDVELQDVLLAQAIQKEIKITFLLTNRVPTTMCNFFRRFPNSDPVTVQRCTTDSYRFGLELYQYLADSTGGNLLIVNKDDIFRATQVIDSTVKQGVVDIGLAFVPGGEGSFEINVDSSIFEVFLQLTGSCQDVSVNFNGNQLDILNQTQIGNLFEGRLMVGSNFGRWEVSLDAGSNTCSAKIIGRSTVGFIQTLAIEERNQGGEVVLERFQGQPLVSDDIVLLLDGYGQQPGDTVTSIEFIHQRTAALLNTISVADISSTHFRLRITNPPTAAFVVRINGVDSRGFSFTRIMGNVINFVRINIDCPEIDEVVFRADNRLVEVSVTVMNNGDNRETFELGATDTQNFVVGRISPNLVSVEGNGGQRRAIVTIQAPNNTNIGTTSIITITAQGDTSSSLLFKTCRVVVGQKARPRVLSFNVDTHISARFAETIMTSVVENNAEVSREADYFVLLPNAAFIVSFSMEIDGIVYEGEIEALERAREIVRIARERDITVGHVASRGTSTKIFQTSVNLSPNQRVTFKLTYQQVLSRKNGRYIYDVSVQMLQPVQSFGIDITICENGRLNNLDVLGFDTDQTSRPEPISLDNLNIIRAGNTARVSYNPSPEEQTHLSPFGLNGRFIIEYDVFRGRGKSEIIRIENDFVHFLSPSFDPLPKRVVFALDISGSMFGHKINQLRQAMDRILNGLTLDDLFSIVVFNSNTTIWTPAGRSTGLIPGTSAFKEDAKVFLNNIMTRGSTDILKSLVTSIDLLEQSLDEGSTDKAIGGRRQSLATADFVVLLTDGRSTTGEINSENILRNVSNLNNGRFAIHTIGFGSLVDVSFLERLSAQNQGQFIQIFVDLDSHLQISDFYDTISMPILTNITVEYPPTRVQKLSKITFPVYYGGGDDLVIAGEFLDPDAITPRSRKRRQIFGDFAFEIRGKRRSGDVKTEEFVDIIDLEELCASSEFQVDQFPMRLRIFLELNDLLRQISASIVPSETQVLRDMALNISLEFGFVTPGVTSIIVIKPEDLKEIEGELAAATTPAPVTTTVPPTLPFRGFGGISGRTVGGGTSRILGGSSGFAGGVTDFREEDLSFFAPPPPSFAALTDDISRSFILPSTTRFFPTFRPLTTTPSPSGRFFVFGDPHVIIDLNPQITICFNLIGGGSKIYNLINDVSTGVTVNAKLIEVVNDSRDRVFVGQVGFKFSKQRATILVTPNIVKISIGSSEKLELFTNNSSSIAKNGFNVKVVVRSQSSTIIQISLDNRIAFQIITHANKNNGESIVSHLDFSITDQRGFSNYVQGFVGLFPKHDKGEGSIDFMPSMDKALLTYRHNVVKVEKSKMYDAYDNREVECWFVKNFIELTGQNMTKFTMKHILQRPSKLQFVSLLK